MVHKKQRLIQPAQVAEAAKQKEKENRKFRSFLKNHAEPGLLDQQFLQLHKEIFPYYDCSKCRNCCKYLHAEIPQDELAWDAAALGMEPQAFIANYLEIGDYGEWRSKTLPCGLLGTNGMCKLSELRPESCKKFPYTDQPDRLASLYSVLNAVSICPVAYEIFEALKKIYGFGHHRRGEMTRWQNDCSDEAFFVAGHTSWGFPYGYTQEETEQEEDSSEQLPF